MKKVKDCFVTLLLWLFKAFLICYGIPALVVFLIFMCVIYGFVFLFFELPFRLFQKKPNIIIIGR
ncbi:MAG: hypothetical protein QXR60_02675 [Candidatus Nanoarchaeia archaeon]